MSYETLRRFYYGTEEKYAAEYHMRFSSEEAVKLDFFIAGKQAFFLVNADVLRLSYEIAKVDKEVYQLSTKLPGVAKKQYSKKCLIDEIVLTNKIEGVHSSRKEIGEALAILEQQSNERKKHPRFISLVNKYMKLMTGEVVPLQSCRDVRQIYDEIFLEEVVSEEPRNAPDGELFRKEMSAVYSETDRIIHKGLTPEDKIIKAMEQALYFLNDESVEKLYRICLFHYLIEYIHPFYDGNGRLGRFILSYCISETLEPLLAYRISETIKEHVREYYRAFTVCNDPRNLADLTPFLIMQLEMICIAIGDLRDSLKRRLSSWNKYEQLTDSLPNAASINMCRLYSYLIQAALFSENGISTADLRTQFEASYNTVKNLLRQVPEEMLIVQKKGRSKYYQIDLNILDEVLLEKQADAQIKLF